MKIDGSNEFIRESRKKLSKMKNNKKVEGKKDNKKLLPVTEKEGTFKKLKNFFKRHARGIIIGASVLGLGGLFGNSNHSEDKSKVDYQGMAINPYNPNNDENKGKYDEVIEEAMEELNNDGIEFNGNEPRENDYYNSGNTETPNVTDGQPDNTAEAKEENENMGAIKKKSDELAGEKVIPGESDGSNKPNKPNKPDNIVVDGGGNISDSGTSQEKPQEEPQDGYVEEDLKVEFFSSLQDDINAEINDEDVIEEGDNYIKESDKVIEGTDEIER